jgi:hypothetical protein
MKGPITTRFGRWGCLGIVIALTALGSFTYALGSGEWWVYGEDSKNYYHYTGGSPRSYIALSKAQSTNCPAFDRHNIATWCN